MSVITGHSCGCVQHASSAAVYWDRCDAHAHLDSPDYQDEVGELKRKLARHEKLWLRAVAWRSQGQRARWSTAASLALVDCVDGMLKEHGQ